MNPLLELIDSSEKSDETKKTYKQCVSSFLVFAGEDPTGWEPRTVLAWREYLRSQLPSGKTVNKYLYALRYASKMYAAYGYGEDFARPVESVHVIDESKRKAMTLDEVNRMLATCYRGTPRDVRDRAIMIVGIKTGLRASALAGANWAGINGRILSVATKGRRIQHVTLDDECLAALENWARWLESQGLKRHGPIFRGISQQGIDNSYTVRRRLTRQMLHKTISRRGEQAAIGRPIFPHLFRHTFITWALEAGVPPQRVMLQSGHKSLSTLSRYVSDLNAEADPVGNYLPKLGVDYE